MTNGDPFGFGTNLLGQTVRPSSDPRVLTTSDTFAVDCSSPAAEDGTDISAEWANEIVANLRALLRANGKKIDGVTPIVTEDHSDGMLSAALLNALQRGRPNYCVDSGAADAIVANPPVAPAELVDGMEFAVKAAHANATTAPTANIGGTGALPLKLSNGAAPAVGDISAVVTRIRYDAGTNAWRLAGLAPSQIGALMPSIPASGPGVAANQFVCQTIATALGNPGNCGFSLGLVATAAQIQGGTWPGVTTADVSGWSGVNSANGGFNAGQLNPPTTDAVNGTMGGSWTLAHWVPLWSMSYSSYYFVLFWVRNPGT
jgi:hypothetical protein